MSLDEVAWRGFRDAFVRGITDRVSADQLDRLFRAAQPPERAPLSLLDARAGRRADEPAAEQLAFALDQARAHGFEREFAFRLCDGLDVSREAIEQAARAFGGDDPAEAVRFEALSNALEGFSQPAQVAHGMQRGRLNTCMIEIDCPEGPRLATGFLLRADLVLTSFHTFGAPRRIGEAGPSDALIEERAGPDGSIRYGALPGARSRIAVIFNNYRDPGRVGQGQGLGERVELAEDWLVAASPATPVDARRLDYVLIRLRTGPPTLPRGLEPAPAAFPATAEEGAIVYLFQHPRGAPIRVSQGRVRTRSEAIARYGVDVNALGGASGGPYTDRHFRVFALHQGGVSDRDQLPGLAAGANVGVPISAILADVGPWPPISLLPRALVVNGPAGRQPLVGRALLRDWAARALAVDGPRILEVVEAIPGPHAARLGLTFTAAVLEAMLPEGEHEIRRLGAEQGWHAMDPLRFCELLLGAAPGAAPLRSLAEAATTPDRWLAGPLLDDFRAAMRARLGRGEAAGGKLFWLLLDDLQRVEIPPQTGLREFLTELYREAARGDWLRVILLGYRGQPLDPVAFRAEREDLWPLGREAILEYLTELDRRVEEAQTPDRIKLNGLIADKVALLMLNPAARQMWFPQARCGTEAMALGLSLMVGQTLLKLDRG